ncbi:putative proline-rich receptor-like protein kinase PERK8 [Iris pallida]|uniref:Proline-rich receptor-like protein kinase PERK8 n=1 Tax=Iris pallida TaxID=29817 RepID=A0AAX6IKS2_IRIPA|nr:putative proline-rich receptor-like protein kinase PERK8 [Iris pallida]
MKLGSSSRGLGAAKYGGTGFWKMTLVDRRLGEDRDRSEGGARWSMAQPTPDLDGEDGRSPSGPRESTVDEGRVEAHGEKTRAVLGADSLAASSRSLGRLLLAHR